MSSLTQGPVSIPRTGKLLSCGLRRASSASVLGRRPGPRWGRTLVSSLPPRLSPSFSLPLPLPSPSASQRWQPLQMETPGWTDSSLQWSLTCLLTADLLTGAWAPRPPLHQPPPLFLWKPSLISCCRGPDTESSEPLPGGLSGQGCPRAGLGVPPRGAAGLSCILSLLPLLLLLDLLPSPPPPAPSSFHKGTKALAPPRMDSEARSGVSRRLFGLPGRPTGRSVLGAPHHKWLCTWSYFTCF